MAKHGLTRVQFRGDKLFVIAGSLPPVVAVRGLTEELVVEEPQPSPLTRRHLTKKPNKPALTTLASQAEPVLPVEKENESAS